MLRRLYRWAWPDVRAMVRDAFEDEVYRRLHACEISIQELWKAHNARDAEHR